MDPAIPLALLLVGVIIGGCGGPGGSSATLEAGETTTTTASPSGVPRSDTPPTASPPTDAPMATPPIASISVQGGDPVVAQLGSFAWDNSGSDSPWLQGNPIRVGAGERLMLTLPDPAGVENWTARSAPAGTDGSGVVGIGEGSGEPIAFDAPPPGSWTVNVDVWFAANRGSAAYYWLVEVD